MFWASEILRGHRGGTCGREERVILYTLHFPRVCHCWEALCTAPAWVSVGSVRNAGACPWNSTSASSGGLAPGALATPTPDLPPGAAPGPFTAPQPCSCDSEGSPQSLRAAHGFLWTPLRGLQVAVGFMFHCERSQQGAVGGRAGGRVRRGGLSPPSGAPNWL